MSRLLWAGTLVYLLTVVSLTSRQIEAPPQAVGASTSAVPRTGSRAGQAIFRYDTFGDEQLWTDVLRMNDVLPTISPDLALAVGLKVDAAALPSAIVEDLRANRLDVHDPGVTVALLQLDAVVGVRGTFDRSGRLAQVGVTCALCHSSVDDALAPGIGERLDGWANTDLDVGAIVALSPALDEATRTEFRSWGPGKYDPRHHAFCGRCTVRQCRS